MDTELARHKRAWAELLASTIPATRVLVVTGNAYDSKHRKANKVLVDVQERSRIDQLRQALNLDDSQLVDTMTLGHPTVVFLLYREPIAQFSLVRGTDVVRWPPGFGDAGLRNPMQLRRWFLDEGINFWE